MTGTGASEADQDAARGGSPAPTHGTGALDEPEARALMADLAAAGHDVPTPAT